MQLVWEGSASEELLAGNEVQVPFKGPLQPIFYYFDVLLGTFLAAASSQMA